MRKPISLEELLKGYPSISQTPVAWGEMDAAQHVNNIVYFRYSETGRVNYLNLLKFTIDTKNPENAIGPILAEISCRYKMPLVFPDTVYIATKVDLDSFDEYSFDMVQVIVSEKHTRIAAESRAKIVTYDYQQLKKAPLPLQLIENIKSLEGR